MELFTASLYLKKDVARHGIFLLDTTVKSGDGVFAPTWDIVMQHKRSDKTPEDDVAYTQVYLSLMRQSYKKNRDHWMSLFNHDRLALGCYCHAGKFCHRHLLKDILLKLSQACNKEVIYKGEITRQGIVM